MKLLDLRRVFGRRPSPEEILRRKVEIEARHGPWTAHNVRLCDSVWTVKEGVANFDEKTRRAIQLAHDFFGPDLSGLRVLDLGAGEGGLSLEFARHGARVVCVEGRESNLAKARFVAEVLGLRGISFLCEDVRNLGKLKRQFDLVLCYGLLYHLDAVAAFDLVETIHQLASRIAVIDTHYSLVNEQSVELRGELYSGRSFREFAEGMTAADMLNSPWSAMGNTTSFWFTRPSLLNLLNRVGFSTVYEVASPLVFDYYDRATDVRYKYEDRGTFVAVRGANAQVLTSPEVNRMPQRRWPESLGEQLVASPKGG
ncbi:MAG TPA: class I SAM-dependent methyltransferase [Thermoanaerobaculia bacterium]|nr:class I SAM-dependent methyltransferase [Thermoanaerobaculia bacterium]